MNRVASKLYLPGHPGNYPIHNPNTHFVTSSDHAKLVIQPFHQHPCMLTIWYKDQSWWHGRPVHPWEKDPV
jgi:hypothetical protein